MLSEFLKRDPLTQRFSQDARFLFVDSEINEFCFGGTQQEAEKVNRLLAQHRMQIPEKLRSHKNISQCISDSLAYSDEFKLDWNFFVLMVTAARIYIQKNHPEFELIDFDRYFVTQSTEEKTTGFSGKPEGGYYYFNDCGFSCVCSEDIQNRFIRAFELARNFLHDSLHRSTFKSFGLNQTLRQTMKFTGVTTGLIKGLKAV